MQTSEEIHYRLIPGWPDYRVGDDGSVWSKARIGRQRHPCAIWRPKKPHALPSGYLYVNLSRANKCQHRFVHRLVLETFIGPCPPVMEACHLDGDKRNNTLANLRWDTRNGNEADKVAHGRSNRGERHGMAKLTEAAVIAIRLALLHPGISRRRLAANYGVSRGQIDRIASGLSWRHLKIKKAGDGDEEASDE